MKKLKRRKSSLCGESNRTIRPGDLQDRGVLSQKGVEIMKLVGLRFSCNKGLSVSLLAASTKRLSELGHVGMSKFPVLLWGYFLCFSSESFSPSPVFEKEIIS